MQPSSIQTFKLGLIGYPLSHSLSPNIHTAALNACGLEGDYSLFPVAPEDKQSLKDLLVRVRSGEIHGLNVTVPHKQNVIQFLDELTPTAESIGAVNTIYLREKKLMGDNTDAMGFITDLKRFLDGRKHLHRTQLQVSIIDHRKSSMILGAGGSARAVVYALVNDGWNVTIAARRPEQAEQLTMFFAQHKLRITNYGLSNIESSNISLIVNATPLGMTPNIDQSPWPKDVPFPAHAAIYDLVYNPNETKLVRDACSQGLLATTGLGMLIEQATLAFELWTGHNPSRTVMLDAVSQTTH